MNFIFSFLLASVMWVQVPQWEADWSKCAVDVPDSSCHWYVAAPDNTFGEGFNWENAPWFDANGLQDVAKIEKESVVEKLQNNFHLNQFKNKHKYQILENYWKKRKRECEKNLSKFC